MGQDDSDSEFVQVTDISGESLGSAIVPTVRLKRDGSSNLVAQATGPGPLKGAQPTRIGRFVIVRRVGVGGMGLVYSAYDEELDRKVAIKVLHADSGGSSGRARILREAQVLARLSHPNIIHVYEVGELDNGQVFMAMEFFEGMTVSDWAHAKQRSWRTLLSIYLQTAQGLAAAHEIGLVHRDVKPENILVDSRGRAVLLDFGLARMRGDASERPTQEPGEADVGPGELLDRIANVSQSAAEVIARTLTATGSIMGTPAYMSPEQCAGLPADARSDQFSFCVSLYEGLYGERPFAGRDLSSVILAICQGEIRDPPRGSRVPTWLRRVLLRGLAVKPSERWPSMQALALALGRDRQSLRRRWFGAAAVAASVAVGLFGAWQPWSGPELCRGAQQRLRGVWDTPRQQAVEQALTATGFAYGEQSWSLVRERVSAYTNSWAQTYEDACTVHQRGETSAELYDRQMACLDRRLTEVQALVDILADADAMVLQQTSELIAGLQPVATCGDTESLRESYAPPANQKAADTVRNLRSELVRIRLRVDSGHADKVVDAAQGVVRAARTLGYRPLLAEALFQLGFVRMGLMQEQETQDAFLDAFLTADAVRHDQVAAEAGAWLVFLNARRGHETEAKLRAEHVAAVIERYGRTSIADVNLHRGLATVHFFAGRFSEARLGLQHALVIAESLPDGQGELLATRIHINIGQICEYQGDAGCMSSNYEEAMEGVKNRLGPDDPGQTMYRYMLAKARLHQGRYDEAHELVLSSLTTIRRTFGERHHLYARCLNYAAEVSMLRGNLDLARTYSKQALEISTELFTEVNSLHTWATVLGAKILGARGEFSQALELANLERDALVQAQNEDAHGADKLLLIQAQALLSMEKNAEAIESFERFLAEADRSDIGARLHRCTAYVGLARAYTRSGDDAHAQKMLADADRLLVSMGDDHWAWADSLGARAELAMAQGRIDEAIDSAERMMTLLRRSGCSRIEIPRARFVLARAVALRDPSLATKLANQAQAEAKAIVGADPKTLSEIEDWLKNHVENSQT